MISGVILSVVVSENHRKFLSTTTLLRDIIDVEPSSYEEVAKKKGKEIMINEYQLIWRNVV